MPVEIVDIEASTPFAITRESVLGRLGGENDIAVDDPEVSARHARIFPRDDGWFLEDLTSANGTFINDLEIDQPVELVAGMRFALCERWFEVVRVSADPAPATATGEAAAAGGPGAPPRPVVLPLAATTKRESRSPLWRKRVQPALAARDPLLTYLVRALAGAFIFYIVAIPTVLVNPIGNLRRGINDKPIDAFGPRTLIAFALPPLMLGVLLASGPGLVISIIDGTFNPRAILPLLIQLVAVTMVAVIVGFGFHPVVSWLVASLDGKSDNQSRSNYFVTLFTVVPFLFVGPGVAATVAGVSLPFIAALSHLVMLLAVLLVLYVTYAWFVAFGVSRGASKAILIVMGASLVGVTFPLVDVAQRGLAQLRAENDSPAGAHNGAQQEAGEAPDGEPPGRIDDPVEAP